MDKDKYIGRLLDNRYEILEPIGSGGMAVVYKARCHRLNRLVAIKILKDDFSQDEEFRRRFHAESQAVAMLSHPNIVSVYDVSTSDDADFIVMELIDGITLKQYMEKKGVLNWKETLHFAIQIAKALEHAHSRGIVHRDIKPHNVMVLKNGSVKVADFGIARVMSKSNTLTKEALGSVHYISPEQAKGGRVDSRSDIYSLGVVMYEIMTGRPPYDGDSPVAVAIQHINGKPQMPSTLNPNIPGGLEQIIVKAMAQDPGKRFPTATAMLHDMDEFRKDPTILFDYNNPNTGVDDATMILNAIPVPEKVQQPPKTTAERVAGRNTAGGTVRKAPDSRSAKPKDARPRRRREEIVEEEERGSKVATIAVILCSVLVLLAIGVIIFVLAGGDSGISSTQNTVVVPNLINKHIDDVIDSTDYVIEIDNNVYSDIYEKGRIMDQNPKALTQIEKGDKVVVVVSAGPQPTEKLMEDLVKLDEQQALKFLINTMGIAEERILIRREASSEVEEGRVIRTDPVHGAKLDENQTIYLTVSTGPSVKTAPMPKVVGWNVETAKKILNASGFFNITVEEVESTRTQGEVFYQSVEAQKEIPVSTAIILRIPKWKEVTEPTQPSITDPTIPPEDYVAKVVEIALPDDAIEDYVLGIYKDGVLVEERDIPVGTIAAEFELTGKGKMQFEVRLSTGAVWPIEVDFDEPIEE